MIIEPTHTPEQIEAMKTVMNKARNNLRKMEKFVQSEVFHMEQMILFKKFEEAEKHMKTLTIFNLSDYIFRLAAGNIERFEDPFELMDAAVEYSKEKFVEYMNDDQS